jgi:hypothetical protein
VTWARTRAVCGVLTAALSACTRATHSPPAEPEPGIVGTWRLVEFWDRPAADAPPAFPFGERPCGYIIYTPTGHVSVHLARTPLAGNLPRDSVRGGLPSDPATAVDMLAGAAAYFGTYTVRPERGVVVHQVEGDVLRRYVGREEERPFRLRGDSLVLGDDRTWRRALVRARPGDPPNLACARAGR